MDKTNTQHAPNGGQPAVYPPFMKNKDERAPDPRETAQEAVHEVVSKDAITAVPVPAKKVVTDAPPGAAKGDDDVMSQQKKPS